MKARLNIQTAAPTAFRPMQELERGLIAGLDPLLADLVRLRASQINGCAYCLHKHTSDALRRGETAERLFLLDAWRESNLYSSRERAALGWTEALTRVDRTRAPDADFAAVSAEFSEREIVDLTMLIGTINSWNRIAIGLRMEHPNDVARARGAA